MHDLHPELELVMAMPLLWREAPGPEEQPVNDKRSDSAMNARVLMKLPAGTGEYILYPGCR
jgi:hypothetical protein